MACEFKDGVIVAADSRTTTGNYIGFFVLILLNILLIKANRVTDKLTKVDDKIFCCR